MIILLPLLHIGLNSNFKINQDWQIHVHVLESVTEIAGVFNFRVLMIGILKKKKFTGEKLNNSTSGSGYNR